MFSPADLGDSPGSTTTYVLRLLMITFAHSATTTPPDKYRRDTRGSALNSGDIINIVGALLGLLVGLPGVVVVFIQARKYWRRRTRKRVSDVEMNISTPENTTEPISPAASNSITININNTWSPRFSRHDALVPIRAATQYQGTREVRNPQQGAEPISPPPAAERASTWPWHHG